jgi:hypothetical protein
MLNDYHPNVVVMKLHILSDLHTEFSDFSPPGTDADVVVLAGDIGVGTGGIDWAKRQFSDARVLYVPGNHEYYGHDIGDTDLLAAVAPANVQVLNDDTCDRGRREWRKGQRRRGLLLAPSVAPGPVGPTAGPVPSSTRCSFAPDFDCCQY